MQQHFKKLIPAIFVLLFLASCSSKTNKEGKMIPKTTGFVIHINAKSLSEKANMAELRQQDWYTSWTSKLEGDSTTPPFLKKVWASPSSTGVDTAGNFFVFGEKNGDGDMNIVMTGGIKDPAKFLATLKEAYPEGQVSKEGDINIFPIKGHLAVTWNNENFVVGIPSSMHGRYMRDSIATTEAPIPSFAGLKDYCLKLYSLKDDENMTRDEKFSELMNTEGDFHGWMKFDNIMDIGPEQMGMLAMFKLDPFIRGHIFTYTANFEKGKVVLKTKNYMSDELSKIFKKYSDGEINTDMIRYIPSKNVVGVLAWRINPKAIREMIELSGMEGFIDLMTVRQGYTLNDILKAFKGNVMISVSDMDPKRDSTHENFHSKILLAAAIDDKASFNKLNKFLQEMQGNEKYIHLKSNDKFLVISTDSAMADQYLLANKNDQPFISMISGKPVGGYVDIKKIIAALDPVVKDSLEREVWNESVKFWDNIVATGGNYSNGGINMQYEMNLLDKNTNSLQQIIHYAVRMATIEKEHHKEIEEKFKTKPPVSDSITTKTKPVPPVKKKKKR